MNKIEEIFQNYKYFFLKLQFIQFLYQRQEMI